MKTGWSPDLIHPGNYNVGRFKDAGLLKPIDTSRLKNFNDIIESVRSDDSCVYDGKQYMVPTEYGNSSIIYRKDLVDAKYLDNPSWGILYDDKYAGRLAQYETAAAVVVSGERILSSVVSSHEDSMPRIIFTETFHFVPRGQRGVAS